MTQDSQPFSHHKILTREQLLSTARDLKRQGKTLVFTNGCFDLLHVGHVKYLQIAASRGDALIVGLNSDHSVKRLKGPERPVISEAERAYMLSALAAVDYVTIFEEDTPIPLLELIRPDLLIKGGDYTPDQVVGADVVLKQGGQVETVGLVKGKSTTQLLGKIREQS